MQTHSKTTTKFYVGDGEVSEAFTALANCTELSWSGQKWEDEDTTPFNDDLDMTFEKTVYDNGEITFVLNPIDWTDDLVLILEGLYNTSDPWNFRFEEQGDVKEFEGYVLKFDQMTPTTGQWTAEVTVGINGVMTEV